MEAKKATQKRKARRKRARAERGRKERAQREESERRLQAAQEKREQAQRRFEASGGYLLEIHQGLPRIKESAFQFLLDEQQPAWITAKHHRKTEEHKEEH